MLIFYSFSRKFAGRKKRTALGILIQRAVKESLKCVRKAAIKPLNVLIPEDRALECPTVRPSPTRSLIRPEIHFKAKSWSCIFHAGKAHDRSGCNCVIVSLFCTFVSNRQSCALPVRTVWECLLNFHRKSFFPDFPVHSTSFHAEKAETENIMIAKITTAFIRPHSIGL